MWKVKKVKCTLVQALKLCTDRTAHRGSRSVALLFLEYGTRRRWGVSVTPRPLFTPGKEWVPILQEAGWAPGPVWTDAENLVTIRIRSPDRPARSQSLYRLSYPAPLAMMCISQNSSELWCKAGTRMWHRVSKVSLLAAMHEWWILLYPLRTRWGTYLRCCSQGGRSS